MPDGYAIYYVGVVDADTRLLLRMHALLFLSSFLLALYSTLTPRSVLASSHDRLEN